MFEIILEPMPLTKAPDEMLLMPVTQIDTALREAGIPIDGVSMKDGEVRIDFAEDATDEDKAAAAAVLKGKTFEPMRLRTFDQIAAELSAEQIEASLRHMAAKEIAGNPELAKQLKVDLYVPATSTEPADSDDVRSAEPKVRRR